MIMGKREKERIYSFIMFVIYVMIVVIVLLPLALLFVSSLRPGDDLMRYGLNFSIDWEHANFDNYVQLLFGANDYFRWYLNSLTVTVIQTGLALFLSACVGY
jgi:arabinosaccharide transport system permease protein